MHINYYDFHYTVIKNGNDKKIVKDEYENTYITPNHYFGQKNGNVMLRWRNLRCYINFFKNLSFINRDAKMNSRKCEICIIDVHRASYAKHLRSKKHLIIEKHNELIVPEWLFQEAFDKKIKKI